MYIYSWRRGQLRCIREVGGPYPKKVWYGRQLFLTWKLQNIKDFHLPSTEPRTVLDTQKVLDSHWKKKGRKMRWRGREEGRATLSNTMTLKSFIRGAGTRVWARRWFLDVYNRGPRSFQNLPVTTWEAVTGAKNTLAPDLQLHLCCQARYMYLD